MTRRTWRSELVDYLGIAAGSLVTAAGLDWFLVPGKIAAGGASGLATIIYYWLHLPVGATMLAINIPLFVLSIWLLGARYGAKTLWGTVLTSVFVDALAPHMEPPTSDLALASVFGGALAGLGVGLTFRFGGSTGGTDMAAQLLQRVFHTTAGRMLLIVDGFVIALAAVAFDVTLAMWALISVFVTTKTVDLVQLGGTYARGILILSEHAEEIGQAILRQLDRGVTSLAGRGLYTGRSREVLFVVVSRQQLRSLRRVVQQYDPHAFVVIVDVYDVLGEGFHDYG